MNKYGAEVDFKIIPIASPHFEETGEDIINDSPYTTLVSDGIILMIPNHYPPNVSNQPAGLFDHQFIKHYLNGNKSGPKILNDLACMVSTFRMRPPSINWFIENEWDHKACSNLVPYPEKLED